jgi:hypothetical protein
MASATKTKAQLEAENAELQAQLQAREPEHPPVEATASLAAFEQLQGELEAALARVTELEKTQPRDNTLAQVVWLQKSPPQGDKRGHTPKGIKFLRFGAQYSRLDEQSGTRFYGAWKNYCAYGVVAEAIAEFFQGSDRLVKLTAFEKPWHGAPLPGTVYPTRNSEWIVTAFEPMPRVDAEASAPQTVAAGEVYPDPTEDEIPF